MAFLVVSLLALSQVVWRYAGAWLPADARRTVLFTLPIFVAVGVLPILPKLRTPAQVADAPSAATFVLLVESVKLVLATGALAVTSIVWRHERAADERMEAVLASARVMEAQQQHVAPATLFVRAKALSRFVLLAFLYTLLNNLKARRTTAFFMLDPGTYTVLNNLTIFTVALLYRVVFRRPFTNYQVVALVLLVTGLFVSQLTMLTSGAVHHMDPAHPGRGIPHAQAPGLHTTLVHGALLMLTGSVVASVADVLNEYALKNMGAHQESFLVQSLVMYASGVVFCLLNVVAWNYDRLAEEYARAAHMDLWSSLTVLLSAVGGISIGLCFRYTHGGNINKIFADAAALLLTFVLSVSVLNHAPRFDVLAAIVIIVCSLYVYSNEALFHRDPHGPPPSSAAAAAIVNN